MIRPGDFMCAVFVLLLSLIPLAGAAELQPAITPSATPAPAASYFVSIKPQSKGVLVNVRSGPGQHYPLEWTLVRARWPLEVLRIFEHWRQVRDVDGSVGWVHKNMLSGKRFVSFVKQTPLYADPQTTSDIVAQVDRDVIAQPLTCDDSWCRVRVDNLKGWVERTTLWGLYPHETKF